MAPSLVSFRVFVLYIFSALASLARTDAYYDNNNGQYDVYAPFSGAIYVVNGYGSGYYEGYCPDSGWDSCSGNAGWCCSSNCGCQQMSNGFIGCCPQGSQCYGIAAVSTVTVYDKTYVTTTVNNVYVANTPTTQYVYHATSPAPVYNGYCSTLVADGPGLPTTRQGSCGTILVVSEAERALVRMGWWVVGCMILGVGLFHVVWARAIVHGLV